MGPEVCLSTIHLPSPLRTGSQLLSAHHEICKMAAATNIPISSCLVRSKTFPVTVFPPPPRTMCGGRLVYGPIPWEMALISASPYFLLCPDYSYHACHAPARW